MPGEAGRGRIEDGDLRDLGHRLRIRRRRPLLARPNKANFFGVMAYDRTWFDHDRYAVTIGGGFMTILVATWPCFRRSTAPPHQSGTPYFTENPGQKIYQRDVQLNFQYMPKTGSPGEPKPRSGIRTFPTGAARGVTPRWQYGAPASFVLQ